jgi:hypothetical protein
MTGMQTRDFTRYSVTLSRREMRRQRRTRYLEWGLIAAACVVIVVFAVLLLIGGPA